VVMGRMRTTVLFNQIIRVRIIPQSDSHAG
jgi:hypothetical protein